MGSFVKIPDALAAQQVPKHVLTLDEVEFALGKAQLVKELRAIGALQGKQDGRTILFQERDVARVSREYFEGKYDIQLERIRK